MDCAPMESIAVRAFVCYRCKVTVRDSTPGQVRPVRSPLKKKISAVISVLCMAKVVRLQICLFLMQQRERISARANF